MLRCVDGECAKSMSPSSSSTCCRLRRRDEEAIIVLYGAARPCCVTGRVVYLWISAFGSTLKLAVLLREIDTGLMDESAASEVSHENLDGEEI